MLKLVFGGIILLFVIGVVFFAGFVLGTTVTPLPPATVVPAMAHVAFHG
ncbi:hypothetical protein QFZ53_002813 [Microbacterium natoriense]|uniref:Histidine kinase n=1 Tax=Microbacterium natoriense TaxID=284570 RepID=A0AAW8F242_9MICO|nr:hypothetical protein [Microbacterium natoriense]MDQ0648617.1 hypothetical protein [Microbacterium natoriense]